jgi:hypothetical protein
MPAKARKIWAMSPILKKKNITAHNIIRRPAPTTSKFFMIFGFVFNLFGI